MVEKQLKEKTISGGDDGDVDDEDDAKFKIDLIELDDSSEDELIPIIKDGAKFNGTCVLEYSFKINIAKRKGNTIQGTIFWETQKTETNFKGRITDDGKINFEEYEIISKGDPVEVPMIYDGGVSNGKTLDGKFGPDLSKLNGKFSINLS